MNMQVGYNSGRNKIVQTQAKNKKVSLRECKTKIAMIILYFKFFTYITMIPDTFYMYIKNCNTENKYMNT